MPEPGAEVVRDRAPVAEWATARPSPALGPWIDRYRGYRLAGFPAATHRGLPSRHMTLIVTIGDPVHVVTQPDPAQAPARYLCVLAGLHVRPAIIGHDGRQEGVAVELTPLGARALLGMPARELWSTSTELAEVVGPAGAELWARLQSPASWAERFNTCDEVLGRLVRAVEPAPGLRLAWDAIVASGGAATVTEVAAGLGWSRQHLARRLRDELGMGPKTLARVVRFERARSALAGARARTIAQAAAMCGYADQSHLDRDFSHFAGCSPRAWLIEEVPSFQDDPAGDWSLWAL